MLLLFACDVRAQVRRHLASSCFDSSSVHDMVTGHNQRMILRAVRSTPRSKLGTRPRGGCGPPPKNKKGGMRAIFLQLLATHVTGKCVCVFNVERVLTSRQACPFTQTYDAVIDNSIEPAVGKLTVSALLPQIKHTFCGFCYVAAYAGGDLSGKASLAPSPLRTQHPPPPLTTTPRFLPCLSSPASPA